MQELLTVFQAIVFQAIFFQAIFLSFTFSLSSQYFSSLFYNDNKSVRTLLGFYVCNCSIIAFHPCSAPIYLNIFERLDF